MPTLLCGALVGRGVFLAVPVLFVDFLAFDRFQLLGTVCGDSDTAGTGGGATILVPSAEDRVCIIVPSYFLAGEKQKGGTENRAGMGHCRRSVWRWIRVGQSLISFSPVCESVNAGIAIGAIRCKGSMGLLYHSRKVTNNNLWCPEARQLK